LLYQVESRDWSADEVHEEHRLPEVLRVVRRDDWQKQETQVDSAAASQLLWA
jgi:hypothetical protein